MLGHLGFRIFCSSLSSQIAWPFKIRFTEGSFGGGNYKVSIDFNNTILFRIYQLGQVAVVSSAQPIKNPRTNSCMCSIPAFLHS